MLWYNTMNSWPHRLDGKVNTGSSFSGCCGSTYGGAVRKIPERLSQRGLALYTNTLIPESESPEEVVKHIKTRNGTLTVAAGLIK